MYSEIKGSCYPSTYMLASSLKAGTKTLPQLRMLANVWYPLVFFKLSFGKSDSFKSIAEKLTAKIPVDNSLNAPSLLNQMDQQLILQEKRGITLSIIKLLRYVPMRFQRPFFKSELRGVLDQKVNNEIMDLANRSFTDVIGK